MYLEQEDFTRHILINLSNPKNKVINIHICTVNNVLQIRSVIAEMFNIVLLRQVSDAKNLQHC